MSEGRMRLDPLGGALGAEVSGVDLAAELSEPALGELRAAFVEHAVLCFRDQQLSPAAQVALAGRFGKPEVHPIVEGSQAHPELVRVVKPAGESASFGVGWHSDNSFFEQPSLGSILYGIVIPPYGGDTLFASTERAYEALSATLREKLSGMTAIHSASRAYDPAITGEDKYRGKAPIRYRYSDVIHEEVEHPVIRTHPESGRRSIYVNPMFTLRIRGLAARESKALLGLLFAHCAQPEFTCRLRWRRGTVAMWDNRSVWHYALDDYQAFERVMQRVTISGDRPV